MKNDRTIKKVAAIAGLLIGAALIVGAAFAWLTMSRNPTVDRTSISVSNSNNFEMALATSDNINQGPEEVSSNDLEKGQTTWGERVDFGAAGAVELNGVATYRDSIEGGIATVRYNKDRRTAGLIPLEKGELDSDGHIFYVSTPATDSDAPQEVRCAGGVAVWLRTNIRTSNKVTATVKDITAEITKDGKTVDRGETPIGLFFNIFHLESEGNLVKLGSVRADGFTDGEYEATIFTGEGDSYMKAGEKYLIEIVSFMDGDYANNKAAVIAADLGNKIRVTIGEIDFEHGGINSNE